MKECMDKERLFLFSPYAVSVTRVEVEGVIFIEKLKEALSNAVKYHELLNARITIENRTGKAYYETQMFDSNPNELLKVYYDVYWKDIVKEQEKLAFDLDHGELIRSFYLINEDKRELIIIAHRLAGDGVSIAYLIQDILRSMAGIVLQPRPIAVPRMASLQAQSKHRKPLREWLWLRGVRKAWSKETKVWKNEDYYQLYASVWNQQESTLIYETFYRNALFAVVSYAKQHGTTMNAVLLAAFAKAAFELKEEALAKEPEAQILPEPIFLELSMRGDYQGMGDYVTTLESAYAYDKELDFAENARRLEDGLGLKDSEKRYAQAKLLSELQGTLLDSLHFAQQGQIKNPTTTKLLERLHMSEHPRGMAVTNLVKLPIAGKYGSYQLKNYVYVPPIAPYAKRAIGIAILHGTMNISLHVKNDEMLPNARLFFQKAMSNLRNLAKGEV